MFQKQNANFSVLSQSFIALHQVSGFLVSMKIMSLTQKYESFGSLAPLARNYLWVILEFLVFWSVVIRHEQDNNYDCYEHRDLIVPTNYVIYQQSIEKNLMS